MSVWVDFKINQDYIAKVLCINREKPSKGCNGKCHLKKQLKKTEPQESQPVPAGEKQQNLIWLYYPEKNTNVTEPFNQDICNNFANANAVWYAYLMRKGIFRPPKQSV